VQFLDEKFPAFAKFRLELLIGMFEVIHLAFHLFASHLFSIAKELFLSNQFLASPAIF
jgi:hypothetical protein